MQKRSRGVSLSQLLPLLEKLHGQKRKIKQDTLLDQVLVGLLSIGTGTGNAVRALRFLSKEFIDWNEVRVSAPEELCEVLASCKITLPATRALTGFLRALFEKSCALTLETIEKEKPAAAHEWMMSLPGAPPQAAAEVALAWFHVPTMPVDAEMRRVLGRLGVIRKSDSDQQVQRAVLKAIGRRDLYRAYHLLIDHAAMVCTTLDYDSEHCVLLSHCETGKERVAQLQEERRKAQEAAEAAAAREKAAQAKAAAILAAAARKQAAAAPKPAAPKSAPASRPKPARRAAVKSGR